MAAPEAEVTTPIFFGKAGKGRFLAATNTPSAASRLFKCYKADSSATTPSICKSVTQS